MPEGKFDLRRDPDRVVLEVIKARGLTTGGVDKPAPSSFASLEAMARGWRMSARQEDCLRDVVTLGRAPEAFRPEATPGDGEP